MLHPDYNYLFLDFETTGLDHSKDEPIQIGIVHIDHTGATVRRFSSFIKPKKDITELKSIVTYLTNINLQDLNNAPTLQDLLPEINAFLTPRTVLIGHNIDFDLRFLQQVIDRTPAYTIDTFPLCKALIHFLPSYALEVIAHHLFPHEQLAAHDALSDCIMNMKVFLHCIQHLQRLREEYMIVDYVIQKSKESVLHKILARVDTAYYFEHTTLFLPPLRRPTKSNTKLVQKNQQKLAPEHLAAKKYYCWKQTLESLLSSIQRSWQEWVLCFSHKSKLQKAEQVLTSYWLTPTTLQNAWVFVPERIDIFLHKRAFDTGELLFVAKYCSHHLQAHTLMDINSSDDYKIFHALTTQKNMEPWTILLSTHEQWYEQQLKIPRHSKVLFFDSDWRRQSLGNFLQKPFDPYHFLQFLDHTLYAYLLMDNTIAAEQTKVILQQATLFFWVLGIEMNTLFKGYSEQKLELESISDHTRIRMSKHSFLQLQRSIQDAHALDTMVIEQLQQRSSKLALLMHWPVIVEKILYNTDQRYYSFSEPQWFHTFDEFEEYLPRANHIFLSLIDKNAPVLSTSSHNQKSIKILRNINHHSPRIVIDYLREHQEHIYILSSSKSHSQDLFQQLIAQKLNQEFLIVAEAITGAVGKITYLATNSKKPVIMIGGHMAFLHARSKKFAVSTLIPYYCEGKQKELLLADCWFY